MKFKHVVLVAILLLVADQILKVYIKTHFYYGQEVNIIGNWFKLHFIENEGMAFGLKFGDNWGKLFLTLFRLVAVIYGFYFIKGLINKKYSNGLIFCATLILAGAMGNLVDSIAYAKIFTASPFHDMSAAKLVAWGKGYGNLFHGRVVDMLYFPILQGTFPKWFPIWGDEKFEFFRPIFNLADMCISTGVISILVLQHWLLKKKA